MSVESEHAGRSYRAAGERNFGSSPLDFVIAVGAFLFDKTRIQRKRKVFAALLVFKIEKFDGIRDVRGHYYVIGRRIDNKTIDKLISVRRKIYKRSSVVGIGHTQRIYRDKHGNSVFVVHGIVVIADVNFNFSFGFGVRHTRGFAVYHHFSVFGNCHVPE